MYILPKIDSTMESWHLHTFPYFDTRMCFFQNIKKTVCLRVLKMLSVPTNYVSAVILHYILGHLWPLQKFKVFEGCYRVGVGSCALSRGGINCLLVFFNSMWYTKTLFKSIDFYPNLQVDSLNWPDYKSQWTPQDYWTKLFCYR